GSEVRYSCYFFHLPSLRVFSCNGHFRFNFGLLLQLLQLAFSRKSALKPTFKQQSCDAWQPGQTLARLRSNFNQYTAPIERVLENYSILTGEVMSHPSVYPVPASAAKRSLLTNEQYMQMYQQSVSAPDTFWAEHGKRLHWF